MDWQAISGLPAGVAMASLAMFFYNQVTVKYLDERKEWLQTLASERADWNEKLERLADRYDQRLAAAIEATTAMRDQMHALRGDMQKMLGGIEARFVALEQYMRGGNRGTRGD